jgi:ornithine carbamoyltransferase
MNHSFLNHRSLWSLDNLSSTDVSTLLNAANALKQASEDGRPQPLLRGKNIAVMCESRANPALQGFTTAAAALGAQVSHIRPSSSHITQPNESHDTAVVLGRLYDAIECEGMAQGLVQEVERNAGLPVFNGLAAATHPLRVLADLMTMREHSGKPLSELKLCFVGDGNSPVGDAWLQSAALTGLDLCIACSPAKMPQPERLERAQRLARRTGAKLHFVQLEEAPAQTVDFLFYEGSASRCSDGRVQLTCACDRALSGTHSPLGAVQVANHRFTLQALLCSTIA